MILADRVAIVTGAGNGIGKATALALARAGARVAAVDVDGGAAKLTADAAAALGPISFGRSGAPAMTGLPTTIRLHAAIRDDRADPHVMPGSRA